jgi:hypothetical protein
MLVETAEDLLVSELASAISSLIFLASTVGTPVITLGVKNYMSGAKLIASTRPISILAG